MEDDQEYVGMHYLTEMPKSIEKWKLKGFSLRAMEEAIHSKLTQQTARDDMFQDFLKIFRIRAKRPGQQDDVSLRIYRDNFYDLLRHIGIFATREQAHQLFSKYDREGRGSISVHEFFQRSRPAYSDNPFTEREVGVNKEPRGKKQYLATKLAGVPVQPHNPPSNVYNLTTEKIADELRFKLQSSLETGKTVSDPFARRYLARHFEFHDQNNMGYVSEYSLKRALDKLNYPLGPNNREQLLGHFPGPIPGSFDYPAFVMAVYPSSSARVQTSLANAADSGINYLKLIQQQQGDRTRTPAPPRAPRSGSQTFRPSTTGSSSRPSWNNNNSTRPQSRQAMTARGPRPRYGAPQQLDWRTSRFPAGHPVYSAPNYAGTSW